MGLCLQDVCLALGNSRVLDNISFTLGDGEFLSLLGASGAGKSTTLKIIAGLIDQDSGHLLMDGEALDDVPPHKRGMAVVFQDVRLFPNMNVAENVAFPLRMQGIGRRERQEKAAEMLELVQLPGFGRRKVQEISGGQQQRVALARAIAGSPRLLLLDEPFSGLDESLRDDMRALVMSLHRRLGMTTLMVTHDAYEALSMSDHIVYLAGGRVVQDGTPAEFYHSPKTLEAAACFGDCSTLVGEVEGGVFRAGAFSLPVVPSVCSDGLAQAVVRDTALHLDEAGKLRLAVAACTYHGDSWRIDIALEAQTLTVRTDTALQPGSFACFSVDTTQVFAFPQSRDAVL
jgi:putative spermidine/putrescine transport system ATP-binding protein